MEKKANPAIERYLLHRMSPEEQHTFEARLSADPALAAELAFFEALWLHRDQQLKTRWSAKGRELFRESEQPGGVSSARAEVTPAQSGSWTIFRSKPYRWAIAATFALLIVAAGAWYITTLQDPYSRLYSAQYERLDASNRLSGAPEVQALPEEKTWNTAFDLYAGEKYPAALAALRPLVDSPEYRNKAYLLIGACYLEQNQPQEAIQAFGQVERKALSLYNKAQFNIALAQLRARDGQAARTQLQKVAADPENKYRKKAAELLEKLPQ